jgi:hypothetical protein
MGVEKHDKRVGAADNPSHDKSRRHLNQTLLGTDSLFDDTMKVVSKYPKAHTKSALAAEMILTAHHEYFDEISPEWRKGIYTKEFHQWRDKTVKYLRDSFPGVAHISLHMDELAPHIHAVVVPVHTKTIAYRRGSKEVTRIRYNDVFGDDMQTIVAARKAGDSEMTKLGRMQSAYAKAMESTGLKRGIVYKKIHHQTIAEYQQQLSAPTTPLEKLDKIPPPSPVEAMQEKLGFETDHSRQAKVIAAENAKKSKKNRETIRQMEAKAKDYDRIKMENEAMKSALIEKDEKLAKQGAELRELADHREMAARLRGLDVAKVAERIGVTATKQDRNAIDLLKNHAGFTYDESIAWLYNEYDNTTAVCEAAKQAAEKAHRITAVKPEQPLTNLDKATAAQVQRQLDALAASRYRITLQAPNEVSATLPTYNMGKGKGEDGKELFYTQQDITRVIPMLRRENTRGYNVYITPYADDKLYLLVDDLTDKTLSEFHSAGYRPNVLQTTSKEKMQAVFVLPKSDVIEPARNALFNELNSKYGDPNITGYTHPFRLAGFTNAKPKHRTPDGKRPIVRVLDTLAATCSKAVQWCRDFVAATTMPRITKQQQVDQARALHANIISNAVDPNQTPSNAASVEATRFYSWIAERYGIDADYSRADWMLAERMTARFTPDDIARAILTHSPGITDRHKDVMRYVNSTVSNSHRPT